MLETLHYINSKFSSNFRADDDDDANKEPINPSESHFVTIEREKNVGDMIKSSAKEPLNFKYGIN